MVPRAPSVGSVAVATRPSTRLGAAGGGLSAARPRGGAGGAWAARAASPPLGSSNENFIPFGSFGATASKRSCQTEPSVATSIRYRNEGEEAIVHARERLSSARWNSGGGGRA